MTIPLEAADAAFAPLAVDGSFDPNTARYLNALGRARPSIVLAFPPKVGGTYLRTAAITAADGQLVRTVHAQGGRDACFYLPILLRYYAGGIPGYPLVTHVHMQALPANRRIMEALDLRPVIMMRSLPDILMSYLDELESDALEPHKWLNIRVPDSYPHLDDEAKADFVIDMMTPWYVSYFSTWLDYARTDPRVLVLDYDDFRDDPAEALEQLLAHSRMPRPYAHCQAVLDALWQERTNFRYNKGVSGRGRLRFSAAQMERLKRQVDYYPDLAPVRERLFEGCG
jgi:sulfotransferase family protein